jgi:phage replication O-like protein O
MNSREIDRFVRLPTELLEALLKVPLSGAQWRILFWVIRQTYGWNRDQTPFSWYRIAKELGLDRGGVARGGHKLLCEKLLILEDDQLHVERDTNRWNGFRLAPSEGEVKPVAMMDVDADKHHRKAMTGIIGSDDKDRLKRCLESTLFRRAKDSSKDRLKTYNDSGEPEVRRHTIGIGNSEVRHLAGAAKPIPGKYDRLSED